MKQSYQEWKQCIIAGNKQGLTKEFVEQRLSVFEKEDHPEYLRFVDTYGEKYAIMVAGYFKKALSELSLFYQDSK